MQSLVKEKSLVSFSKASFVLIFVSISGLSFANSDKWQHEFLYAILFLVVIINICSALFQGGSFGMAGKFPTAYMGAQMGGQAMGGGK